MGFKAFFSSFKSNSRGVAILFNNNCELDVHKRFKDDSGNFLILDVSVDDLHVLLAVIGKAKNVNGTMAPQLLILMGHFHNERAIYLFIGAIL